MSNDNGDRRKVSEHYPTLDTEQLIKPINGVITYFQSVRINNDDTICIDLIISF